MEDLLVQGCFEILLFDVRILRRLCLIVSFVFWDLLHALFCLQKFNGYMGVGIAFPIDSYKVLETDISR